MRKLQGKTGDSMTNLKGARVLTVATLAGMAALTAFCQAPAAPASDQTPATPAAAAAPAAPAGPTALPTPSVTGPISMLPPATVGKIQFNAIADLMGTATTNVVPGDHTTNGTSSNGMVWIQKTDGVFQFFVQAGVYNVPSMGTPFIQLDTTLTDLYGPVPVGFIKLQAGKNTSIEIGSLPTLIGAEYTFTFENMNIARGLVWNQENAINRGIQINQTMGKWAASLSWNDGFYSNRYTWISGSLAYTNGPHALSFVAGGNYGQTAFQKLATPVQNNGSIYNVIYTYTKGAWIVQPYYQFTDVPTNTKIGVLKGASTNGGAILLSYAMKHGFSLPARFEYISSSGTAKDDSVNLMYGAGSGGVSFTVTPTIQHGGFFFRSDLGYVHVTSLTPGDGFGKTGNEAGQFRALAELGFIFGNNLTEKK
jgi:hypothetical protein